MTEMPSDVGRTLRRIRRSRGKSLAVVAGLAGISPSYLSRIESGDRALDRRSLIVSLAEALEVAPSELMALPVPAPGDGGVDSTVADVRCTLMAVNAGYPDGQVCSADELYTRVLDLHTEKRERKLPQVGASLPQLIRDLHTSIDAGAEKERLLDLAVLLHAQDTRGWLWMHHAPIDLRWQAALLAQHAARERGSATALGLATWGAVIEALGSGAFSLARAQLDAVTVPTDTHESMQLAGMLALSRSLVAASASRPSEVEASFEYADELAHRTGQGDAYWLGFGPTNVGLWRMAAALESADYDQAARIGAGLTPEQHPSTERRATYYLDYGRALARLPRRREDAARALRTAEQLHPTRVHRNPFARDVLAELLASAHDNTIGRELRGMAYRAGLPV